MGLEGPRGTLRDRLLLSPPGTRDLAVILTRGTMHGTASQQCRACFHGLHWHQTNCPKPPVLAPKHTLGVLSPRLPAVPGSMVSQPDVPLMV